MATLAIIFLIFCAVIGSIVSPDTEPKRPKPPTVGGNGLTSFEFFEQQAEQYYYIMRQRERLRAAKVISIAICFCIMLWICLTLK